MTAPVIFYRLHGRLLFWLIFTIREILISIYCYLHLIFIHLSLGRPPSTRGPVALHFALRFKLTSIFFLFFFTKKKTFFWELRRNLKFRLVCQIVPSRFQVTFKSFRRNCSQRSCRTNSADIFSWFYEPYLLKNL